MIKIKLHKTDVVCLEEDLKGKRFLTIKHKRKKSRHSKINVGFAKKLKTNEDN
jgi:hypothetical protein